MLEGTKLVNWGTFEDILKVVLIKTSQTSMQLIIDREAGR